MARVQSRAAVPYYYFLTNKGETTNPKKIPDKLINHCEETQDQVSLEPSTIDSEKEEEVTPIKVSTQWQQSRCIYWSWKH